MAITLDGTNGITSPAETVAGQFSSASTMGFKNRIINGAMNIWQRGTSFTVGASSYTYTADRYKVFSANTSTTVSRSTSVPTTAGSLFQYSFQLQRPNGNTGTNSLSINQTIETANCYDLAGQSVTLSFWVKKGSNYSGGNISVQVITGTVADQGGDPYNWTGLATAVNDSTYTPTTSWAKVTYTGTVASNVLEVCPVIAFTPTGTAGADDSVFITGVQLEKGSTATSFDYRPYGTELALCQRYYEKASSTNNSGFAMGAVCFTNTFRFIFPYKVTKRVAPSFNSSGASSFYVQINNGNAVPTTIGASGLTQDQAYLSLGGTYTLGQGGVFIDNVSSPTTAYLEFSAEL